VKGLRSTLTVMGPLSSSRLRPSRARKDEPGQHFAPEPVGKHQRFGGAVRITGKQHESAPLLAGQAHGRIGRIGSSEQNIVEHYILRPGACRVEGKKRAIGA
jgi:hypothetical protein